MFRHFFPFKLLWQDTMVPISALCQRQKRYKNETPVLPEVCLNMHSKVLSCSRLVLQLALLIVFFYFFGITPVTKFAAKEVVPWNSCFFAIQKLQKPNSWHKLLFMNPFKVLRTIFDIQSLLFDIFTRFWWWKPRKRQVVFQNTSVKFIKILNPTFLVSPVSGKIFIALTESSYLQKYYWLP